VNSELKPIVDFNHHIGRWVVEAFVMSNLGGIDVGHVEIVVV
jgi:hypothetical protein